MRISYSAFDTYNRCPFKYKLQYVDNIQTGPKPELFFGSLIHEIVQTALKRDPIIPPVKELLDILQDRWSNKIFPDKLEADQYFSMGQNMIRSFHASLKPGFRNIVATEKRFALPLNNKHTLSGVIDRIDKLPFGAFEVIDYKTSKALPTQNDVDADKQLGLYNFAVSKLWPDAKDIRLTLYFLKHDQQLSTKRVEAEIEEVINNVIKVADEIEAATDFPAKKNSFCDWCEYQDYCTNKVTDIELDNIVGKYLRTLDEVATLEQEIHEQFDAKNLEEFTHKKGVITRSPEKKLKIKIN